MKYEVVLNGKKYEVEVEEGKEIVVPEELITDDFIGWLDASGKLVEVAATMGTSDLTYTAVYKTDKFNVKVNLGGGTYAEDVVLPEDATVEGDTLIIKAYLGETVDLTAIPLPEKEGYTASWQSTTVKVESTKGASVNVKWTIMSFTATFFLDKEAYEAGTEALTTVSFVYNGAVAFAKAESGLAALKPTKKFVGWKNAATGETVEKTTKFKENVTFYADWTDYESTVTVWGRDYTNGGWKAITTKYADVDTLIKISELKALVNEENYGTAAAQYVVAGSASTFSNETAIRSDFKTVKGNQDVYLFTKTNFTATFKTPTFNENGYITDVFTEVTEAVASLTDDTFLTAKVVAETPKEYAGYAFVCWTDEEGNEYTPGEIVLDYANGTAREFTAEYKLVEYSIEFVVDNTSAKKEIISVEGTFTIDDTFKLSEAKLTNEAGEEAILPEIGKENREQVGGPYRNVDGFKFSGWKIGNQASKYEDFTQEIVLTPAVIASAALGNKITIKGFWEALYYDFVANYATAIADDGTVTYEAMPAVKVATGMSLDQAYAAALETVNANLPEGKRFLFWKLEDGSEKPNVMPAYGTEVYATYTGKSLSIYVDYNYGTENAPVALEETMSKSNQYGKFLFHGMDVVKDIPEGETLTIDEMIRKSTVGEETSPGDNYEVVNWNVYYVVDENNVYNPKEWKKGINETEGSTIAKYTLIYQVEWMAHKDFLFRVYNTDGALRSAIDKKFQKYFWYMDKPTNEEGAVELNTLPDRLIVLGFLPKLDGFSFERFFEADMWANLSIRVDPITLSKAWLNPGNWGELIKALWSGITSGFGGAI